MKKTFGGASAMAVFALLSAEAAAADWSGQAFYRPVAQETVKLADGRMIVREVVSGYVSGNGAGNPFDRLQQTCSSTTVVSADGGTREQFGHCDALDGSENLFVLSFHDDTWRIEGGTGRFAKMKGGGTTKVLQTWPDGSYLISWQGATAP